jgi:hypothetical protein
MFKRVHEFTVDTLVDMSTTEAEMYLAGDTHAVTWREEKYAPYKGNRIKSDEIDWDTVWEKLELFKQIMLQYLPWHFVTCDGAEADDIVAVLVREAEEADVTSVVYSSDADYLQLCSAKTNVYRPTHLEYVSFPAQVKIAGAPVKCETPEEFVQLSILTGQGRKDNVYNVKTDTDWVPTPEKKRMPPFGVKAAQKVLAAPDMQDYLEKLGCWDNYQRNKTLIDLRCIPSEVQLAIQQVLKTERILPKNNNLAGLIDAMQWESLAESAVDCHDLYKTIYK